MKVQSRNQVKVLLTYENVKLKDLATLLTEKTGKKYNPSGLSHKINRGRLTYDEMLEVAEILGYEIKFEKLDEE